MLTFLIICHNNNWFQCFPEKWLWETAYALFILTNEETNSKGSNSISNVLRKHVPKLGTKIGKEEFSPSKMFKTIFEDKIDGNIYWGMLTQFVFHLSCQDHCFCCLKSNQVFDFKICRLSLFCHLLSSQHVRLLPPILIL